MADCWVEPAPVSTFMETPASAGLSPLLLSNCLTSKVCPVAGSLRPLFCSYKRKLYWRGPDSPRPPGALYAKAG